MEDEEQAYNISSELSLMVKEKLPVLMGLPCANKAAEMRAAQARMPQFIYTQRSAVCQVQMLLKLFSVFDQFLEHPNGCFLFYLAA